METLVKEPIAPRELVFDTETSLMIFSGWQPGQQYVDPKRILKEREVVCIGYAWNDEPAQVLSFDLSKYDIRSRDDDADLEMLTAFSEIYSQADLVIGHNIKAFDIAVLRARLIKHRLPDLIPVLVDDTLQSIKGIGFSGRSLDYLSRYLGVEQKKDHPYELWLGLLQQDPASLASMMEYCRGDVEHNREIYRILLPYIHSSLNKSIFHGNVNVCPNCGAKGTLMKRGHMHTKSGKYVRVYCKRCHVYRILGNNVISNSGNHPR